MSENKEQVVVEEPVHRWFGDGSLSDAILVVENEEFHVHKMVLAARSDVFKAMFFGQFVENGAERVTIRDVCPVAFRRLMDFIYYGSIEDADSFLCSCAVGRSEFKEGPKKFWTESSALMAVADRFNIQFIRPYVQDRMSRNFVHKEGEQCWECLDGFIFALAHDLQVTQSHRKYLKEELVGWANSWGDVMPANLFIPVNKLHVLFKQLK